MSKINYSDNVDYNKIDPIKIQAQNFAKTTSNNSNIKVVEESYGESAFVWEEQDCFRAFVIEGLGTKNLIADEVRKTTGKTYYDMLAQDTVAMIINDLIVVGAKPQVINAYFASGSSNWFADKQRSNDLTLGFANACKIAGVVWGGGESPVLNGIINEQTADLAGSAIGIIKPKHRLTLADKLLEGDSIILIESSGIHANGLTLARSIAKNLEEKYETNLSDGQTFGQALLTPTYIYASIVDELFNQDIDIHYMVNITGHGFRKLMRAKREFTFLLNKLPTPQPIFDFIQEQSGNTDEEMYANFNMGAGFAIFIAPNQVEKALSIISKNNLKSWDAGIVQSGEKQVVIKPKNIIFKATSLNVR